MSTLAEIMSDPIECSRRCGWQWPATPDAEHRRAVHENRAHDEPMPDQPVTGGTWQEQAIDALRQVAGQGRVFTVYEALAEFGLANPPNHKAALGRLAVLAHDLLVCHPCGADKSLRPGTKSSNANVWHRDPRKCIDVKCRRRTGVA